MGLCFLFWGFSDFSCLPALWGWVRKWVGWMVFVRFILGGVVDDLERGHMGAYVISCRHGLGYDLGLIGYVRYAQESGQTCPLVRNAGLGWGCAPVPLSRLRLVDPPWDTQVPTFVALCGSQAVW